MTHSRISFVPTALFIAALSAPAVAQLQFQELPRKGLPVASGDTNSVALVDIDGDGDLDMVVGNRGGSGRQTRLYLNSGTGTFTDATAQRMPVDDDETTSLAIGDVDGDGDLDMVVGNWGQFGQQNRLYLNNGTGTFTDATAQRMPVDDDYTSSLVLGDVDGDGDLDMVVGNRLQNLLYLNNGTGTFTDTTAQRMPVDTDYTEWLTLGDVDGDGDLDMGVGNNRLQNLLYLNNGTGTFTDATAQRMPVAIEFTASLALGDVDRDGDLDMVVGNFQQQNRIYLNLQRQLHAPTAPQIGLPYDLDVYIRYGTSNVANFAVAYLSTAPASITSLFGRIGLDLAQSVPFPTLIVPQPSGVGGVGFTVPNTPSLVGQAIYSQAMLIAYPYDLRLSNVVADVIQ